MLPDHVLASVPFAAQFRFPRNVVRRDLLSYEYGGIALNDPSRGLRFQVWKGEYIEDEIILSAGGVAPVSVLTMPNIAEFDFTFDQNMRVAIAYSLLTGGSRFYWYDTTINDYATLDLGAAITPRCALDDNRDMEIGVSDIILAYVRNGSLYFREQRDRYTVERQLAVNVGNEGLVQIGMNRLWRFQFHLYSATA